MNIEKPKIKIKKLENWKIIFIDNQTWKIITNEKKDNILVEAVLNYAYRQWVDNIEEILSEKSKSIIRNYIIKYKIEDYKEKSEKEEFEKLINNKSEKAFMVLFYIFLNFIFLICMNIAIIQKI